MGEGVELKPCPFCGGEARWVEDTGEFDVPFGLVVEHAEDCFMRPSMMANWVTIISSWNRRHLLEGADNAEG